MNFDSSYYEDRRQDEAAFWALQRGDKEGFFSGVKRAAERKLCLCPNDAVYAGQCYELGFGVKKIRPKRFVCTVKERTISLRRWSR